MYTELGADPEFFFKNKKGEVVGSELVIPKKWICEDGKLIRDGVAAEINPGAAQCRENLWRNVVDCMNTAKEFARTKECEIVFDTTVTLTQEQFDSLSPFSKQFGCVPSSNAYGVNPIPEGAQDQLQRSAGGHIHIGYKNHTESHNVVAQDTDINTIVKVLDIIAGNTCVLFDQYKGSTERRKTYGRAGEYREKYYGLEYRTLSNFWLRDYRLFGLATGLVRQALWVVGYGHTETILSSVNQADIIKAINENDPVLARKNFDKYSKVLVGLNIGQWNYPIDKMTIDSFLDSVDDFGGKKPYEVFNCDWIGSGFEDYLENY
jgi:hypothetical protein